MPKCDANQGADFPRGLSSTMAIDRALGSMHVYLEHYSCICGAGPPGLHDQGTLKTASQGFANIKVLGTLVDGNVVYATPQTIKV